MKAFIFDTETTGLVQTRALRLERQPEVIEFFGQFVNLKTGKVGREIETLVKPKGKISGTITKITGLTDKDVANAPSFAEISDTVCRAISSADAALAHNLSFDRDMIEIELERIGKGVKWPRMICTVEQTIGIHGYRLSLQALHQFCFGEGFPKAHRARTDVEALTRCCVDLYQRGILR